MTDEFKLILAALTEAVVILLSAEIKDAIGEPYGGWIGLLCWLLATALGLLYCWAEYRHEQDVEREKKRIKKFAARIAAAYERTEVRK